MKILGITAEYNPFHNGHKFHIEESRRITGADCVVAVMSGNFTQRGEAAILDKWERSRLAVENGVDLVVELPFVYACAGAKDFAEGAVDILSGLGAQMISFGSESGDMAALESLAESLTDESERITEARAKFMQKGASFAKAGELAAEEILGKDAAALMLEPNNILAIEYLKRMLYFKKRGRTIEPVTVKRHGSGYFEENKNAGFAGASVIRKMKDPEKFSMYVPENVAEALKKPEGYDGAGMAAERALEAEERFFQLVRSEIVKTGPDELAEIYRMGEGLENKLKKEIIMAGDLKELISSVVSKRYTEAAVRRLLVYVLMNMKVYEPPRAVYGRVLAAGEMGRRLLGDIKKQDIHIPLITNVNKDVPDIENVRACIEYDILAADMYNLLHNRGLYAFSDKVKRPYMAGL